MAEKILTIAFYRMEWPRTDWDYQYPEKDVELFLSQITRELEPFGVTVKTQDEDIAIAVNGYGDVLNSVRIRYSVAGLGNLCLGHIIGSSPNANLIEDLRRGVSRVVFAPETVEPDGSDKIVCHNCGCGC